MPKSTNEKNTKGTKKNVASKTNKKTTAKKVETKENKVKKVPVKKVEVNETTKESKKVEKGNKFEGKVTSVVNRVMNDTPLAITLCVCIILAGVLIFTACSKRIPKTSDGKQIVASLKGKNITADDLYVSLKNDYGTDALINLVDEYITKKEVTVTDEDKDYVNEVVNYYKDYAEYYGVDLATFLSSYVGLNGITTEDEFYDFVLADYKKTLAVRKFIGDNASEEELKEYYENNYSDSLTVKHILIEVDEDEEDGEEKALNKAKELIEELDDTSAKDLESKFDELAEDNSDDTTTYSNGGLLEGITKNSVVEEFFEAASKLKDGEYTSEPVKTTYGYHVILKISSTPAKKYKEIKDEVKKSYAENLLSQDPTLITTKWDELRKQYKLSIKDDDIKSTYKNTIDEATEESEEK